ncbi:MAG: hypothetical protein KGH93_02505 [Patescibacteria group bacterium]|nr:hypothetical protein [Patescibacteria group bacterium]MDE1946046.1 hypothetical protein [Patescibacteria group bacterium]
MRQHKTYFLTFVIALLVPLTAAYAAGIVPCSGADCNFGSLVGLINNVINWFLAIAASVAAITFAIAGAKMLFNPANDAKKTEAKAMMWKTIVGLLVILCAWVVLHAVIGAITNPNTGALRFLGK